MQLAYIETASVILLLNDALDIHRVQRVSRGKRLLPHVIRVADLYNTPGGSPRLTESAFETDGLGCIRLLWWIIHERPNASATVHLNRFNALFSDNPADTLRAVLRVFAGTWKAAPGEEGFFCADQWAHHPREMAAIALLGSIR